MGRKVSVGARESGWRVAVPGNNLRREICVHFHDHLLAGHPGVERTIGTIRQFFWWPGMNGEIEQFVRSCVVCSKARASHLKPGGLLQPLPIPSVPWEEIAMDLIVGLPATQEGWDAYLPLCAY